MKKIVQEKNIVVALFVLVIIIFSFAQRDTKKINELYQDAIPVMETTSVKEKEVKDPLPNSSILQVSHNQ